jgi:glutamyl-tRNA synthetase
VRLRLPPERRLAWDDAVFGPSGQDAAEIGDRSIRRSDGGPLYHLAVVVDDLDMDVTHVIRGADHHANTPLQLALYEALGASPPEFAHVPLIVGEGGKKLSKRRDDLSIEHMREQGYLPEALCNWLVRLGWSHGDQEIFAREEIAALFDLENVGRSAASADPDRLLHLNQHYLKNLSADALWDRVEPFLERRVGRPVTRSGALDRLLDLLRERSHTLVEMAERAAFAVLENIPYEEKAAKKHLRPANEAPLADLHDRLAVMETWTEKALEVEFRAVCAAHGDLGMGKLAQPVRVAVTGSAASPGIFETLAILGKPRAVGRIAEALHYIRHGS